MRTLDSTSQLIYYGVTLRDQLHHQAFRYFGSNILTKIQNETWGIRQINLAINQIFDRK
ncbi:MAG: hypothetical protein Q8P20_09955 [bacterium]|nr:hypothetical protein [bacterium]